KAGVSGLIFEVGQLPLKVQPASKTPFDRHVAEFVEWTLTRRLAGAMPGLVWSILSGGLPDGYSVGEKGFTCPPTGKYAGTWPFARGKAKQVGDDLVLQTDDKLNVVGLLGLRYNAGLEFAPANFIIWRHCPLYDSPTGMSLFRSAYSR